MGNCSWDHDDVIDRVSAEIRAARAGLSLRNWLTPFLIGFPLGGLIVLGTIGLLFFAGPQIEGKFGPTIIDASHVVGSVRRSPSELCWETAFKKFDGRPPILFTYFVDVRGFEIPVPAYRIQSDGRKVPLSQAGFARHNIGDEWTSTYCIELPDLIDRLEPFTVRGIGYYASKTGLWRVPIILPSFTVQPNNARLWAPGRRLFSRRSSPTLSITRREPSLQESAIPSSKELVPEENSPDGERLSASSPLRKF